MRRLLGDVIMLAASNCWALNGILCRRAVRYLKPTTITAWGMLWASAALLPFCLFGIGLAEVGGMVQQNWSGIPADKWGCFVYAVLPASTLSIVFFYFGVKKVGPLHTIIYQNASPIITAITVYLMFERPPNIVQVLGVFTIFLGVYLTRTSKGVPDVQQPVDA
jgi:drug/metabolite transporter (DMT)-like permease